MDNLKFSFSKTNAVVTGGAQGIGLQIATEFLQAGAQVAIWDFSEQALMEAQKTLASFKDQAVFKRVDVTQRASCAEAAQSLPWSVTVLINNAGITRDKSFAKMTGEDFDAVIQTNLTGLFNVTQALYSQFDSNHAHKRIINISSVVGLYGNFGQTNYAAAKAGVIGMTKTWAKEFGKKNFTVNAIAPGFIQTKMVQAMPAEVLNQMATKVPVSHLGETKDIANACLFLASKEAGYINGAVLSVDGGLVI